MFDSLSDKLSAAFKKFRNKGKLTEADVKAGMREVKLALLEADVNFKVVKEFIKTVTDRAIGAQVLESLMPAQQIIQICHLENYSTSQIERCMNVKRTGMKKIVKSLLVRDFFII